MPRKLWITCMELFIPKKSKVFLELLKGVARFHVEYDNTPVRISASWIPFYMRIFFQQRYQI